jgi:hypothetical protein
LPKQNHRNGGGAGNIALKPIIVWVNQQNDISTMVYLECDATMILLAVGVTRNWNSSDIISFQKSGGKNADTMVEWCNSLKTLNISGSRLEASFCLFSKIFE